MYNDDLEFFKVRLKMIIMIHSKNGTDSSGIKALIEKGYTKGDGLKYQQILQKIRAWTEKHFPDLFYFAWLCKFTNVDPNYYLFGDMDNLNEDIKTELEVIDRITLDKYIEDKTALKDKKDSIYEMLCRIIDNNILAFLYIFSLYSVKSSGTNDSEIYLVADEINELRKMYDKSDLLYEKLEDKSNKMKQEELLLGRKISSLRNQYERSQKEFGKEFLFGTTLPGIETQGRKIQVGTIEKLSEKFGLSTQYFESLELIPEASDNEFDAYITWLNNVERDNKSGFTKQAKNLAKKLVDELDLERTKKLYQYLNDKIECILSVEVNEIDY